MASTVTTELAPLQSREVDFVGAGRPSTAGLGPPVGDNDDNQSQGTVSELDPTDGDAARGAHLQTSRSQGADTTGRGRGLQGVSQYHSISELSSPSMTGSIASTAVAFCVQPASSSSAFDFSTQQLYGPSESAHVIRGMFHRPTSHAVSDDDDDDDDEEEWATSQQAGMMPDRMSCDEDEFGSGSPRHSVNVSMSSVDELSDADDEQHQLDDLRTKPTTEAVSGNEVPSSSASDSGSAGDDVIEAKRARMESIVTNMRPSLMLSGDRATSNGTETGIAARTSYNGKDDDPKRRPKRKQYIPKQHDASSELDSPDKHQQLDSGEESSIVNDRKSLLPAAEKLALEAELCSVNDQLNYIRRKYAHVFDDPQQMTAGYFCSKNVNENTDVRPTMWRDIKWSQAFHDAFRTQADSEWKKFVKTANGELPSSPLHAVTKQQTDGMSAHERYRAAMQSSPIAGDTPVDVQRLAELLKLEITERVESLVNNIIRDFVTKYGMTSAVDCSSLDIETESKFSPDQREKSPEVAVRRAYTATSGSVAYAEDLSPRRDVDDAHDRPAALMSSTSTASFLSVPSLLLPTPKRPLTTASVDESTPTGGSRSVTDDDAPVHESVDRLSHCSSDIPLSASDQTAFEIPPRTAHHPLYSLFAPHAAYYPNASRMAAAAAAAAAVAANSAYPPMPPVASPMLFPPCREPEQTEALPLVVNAPTKKKRTKVTDTRLSPRAARSILHDGVGHRHHHSGSYHGHSHHHQHARPDSSHHRLHHGVTGDVSADRRRSSPVRSSADSGLVSPFLQSRHPSTGLPTLPLLPASLPTSVAVPNPSLQHSDIMSAIFQFSQQRMQQQQQIDSTPPQQQRYPPPPAPPFVDKFDLKPLVSETQTSASDAFHGSLPSARKAAESNGTDSYESIFHEDGLVSFLYVEYFSYPSCMSD